jgi:hypothetical protein
MEKNKSSVEPEFDCSYKDEMVCPHCGEEQSDSWELEPDDECGEVTCQSCDKEFCVTVDRKTTYSTSCKEGEHEFVVDNWHIDDCMSCKRCGETKFTRHDKQ